MSTPARPLSKQDFENLSDFRYHLRRFLRASEDLIHAKGITPLQYQLLLHVKGYAGREWATVGELAERLQASPHGTVALVTRCEEAGLVERRGGGELRFGSGLAGHGTVLVPFVRDGGRRGQSQQQPCGPS